MTHYVNRVASPRLCSLATAVPPYRVSQNDIVAMSTLAFDRGRSEIDRMLPVFGNAGIERHGVIPLGENHLWAV